MADAPPPSQVPAEKGGNAVVIIGVILLLGAAGGILCWVNKGDDTAKPLPPIASVSAATTTAGPVTTIDLPPIELPKDAGEDTSAAPKIAATGGGGGGGGVGCPTTCTGQITEEIKATAAARAATARQCYKTALEGNEGLSGEIVMMVRVGTNGETCSASVASDTTGSGKLQTCVRGKMIAMYPKPKGGCVDVKVPVVFKPKT